MIVRRRQQAVCEHATFESCSSHTHTHARAAGSLQRCEHRTKVFALTGVQRQNAVYVPRPKPSATLEWPPLRVCASPNDCLCISSARSSLDRPFSVRNLLFSCESPGRRNFVAFRFRWEGERECETRARRRCSSVLRFPFCEPTRSSYVRPLFGCVEMDDRINRIHRTNGRKGGGGTKPDTRAATEEAKKDEHNFPERLGFSVICECFKHFPGSDLIRRRSRWTVIVCILSRLETARRKN